MTIKKRINIGLALCLALLSGCNDDADIVQETLSGDGTKTPLTVTALLDANGKVSQTRAANKEFSTEGDELKVMLRHVTWTGKLRKDNGYVAATDAPKTEVSSTALISKLVTFTAKGNTAYSETDNDILPFEEKNIGIDPSTTNQAATLTADSKLYWDDFSVGGKGDATDIRTDNHYLQSFYGYCYNGGTPSTNLTEATGVLGWSVATDQTAGFTTSDLLWSPAQKPVRYDHATANQTEIHGQVVIPFLHAMSKVTINVTAGEGFKDNYDFKTGSDNTSVTLNDIRLKCTATAPNATLSYPEKGESGAKGNVKMKPGDGKGTRSFEAIIVPSILTVGNTFATIANMDGNTYNIPVTEAMIAEKTDKTGWGNQLDNADEDVDNGIAQAPAARTDNPTTIPVGKGFQMRSGVHYVLNVTVDKTSINVSATILDWEVVEAEGVGEIHFDNDIKADSGKDTITTQLQTHGFDVYMAASGSNTPDYGSRATHLKYNKAAGTWTSKPVIYWSGDAQYFRALSNVYIADNEDTPENESLTMQNGFDALWGTTMEADGYAEGQAVKPRTGAVPLKFYHAMSKITFNLVDANASGTDESAKIVLTNATIQLTNLSDGGKLNLHSGLLADCNSITPGQKTFSEDRGAVPSRMGYFAANDEVNLAASPDVTLKDYIITPQGINENAQVIVTLADGTVYKGQLNLCTTEVIEDGASTNKPVDRWKRGKHYVYTITLTKEQIMFRALVEQWEEKTASGSANLEWD